MKKIYADVYTEYFDGDYVTTTKIYADIPQDAADLIAAAEKWDGCHWDNPRIVFSEQVDGTAPSEFALELMRRIGAEAED